MTPLRQKMIDTMLIHGFTERTQQTYLSAVADLSAHSGQSPGTLSMEQIEAWLLSLVKERKLAPASCRLYFNGVSFLFTKVLKRQDFISHGFVLPKNRQTIPALLNPLEVAAIFSEPTRLRDRMLLMLCYGCGLRVNELIQVKVADIDSQQLLLRVTQGKGNKDRLVPLGETLLQYLRHYWHHYRPRTYLFRGQRSDTHLQATTPQKLYKKSKQAAGIDKQGGIHSLRHAYATHCLQLGMPVHQRQQVLGHRNIHSTLGYTHWLPESGDGGCKLDLLGQLALKPDA